LAATPPPSPFRIPGSGRASRCGWIIWMSPLSWLLRVPQWHREDLIFWKPKAATVLLFLLILLILPILITVFFCNTE
jgi:hypothetical protein